MKTRTRKRYVRMPNDNSWVYKDRFSRAKFSQMSKEERAEEELVRAQAFGQSISPGQKTEDKTDKSGEV